MATAIEMTIALGRTLYGAPHDYTDGEDTIEGHETRVSVTWRLTESEQNLPLTASLLAEKTVQVLETADRTIRGKTQTLPAQTPVPVERMPDTQPVRVTTPEVPPASGATSAVSTAPSDGATSVNGGNGNNIVSRSYTTAFVPRITKTQILAIQSLCTRHAIADWELRRLVWEQFAKKEQSELTKEQAGELLNLLQLSLANDGASEHAYA